MIKQGSAVMRIVAFAVALAVVLGLSSVMFQFTASAETADDVVSQLGTLGNYGCFKYTAGQHVSFEFLRDIYQTSNAPYVVGVVFGYKDGKFVSISKTDTRILLGARSSSDSSLVMSFCSVNLYEADYPDKYDTMYQYFTVYNSGSMYGTTSFKSKNGVKDSSGFKTLADTYSDYVNKFGTTCYAVYTTSSTKWTDSQFVTFQNEIVSNLTDSDYKDIDTGSNPSAEFLSFKGTDSSGLYLVDWIQAGQQYPIVDFRIDDNGNYHKYALRISGNSNYAEVLKGIWDRQEMKEAASAASNAIGLWLLLKTAGSLGTKAVVSIAGASTPIGALFLNVPKKDVTGYVMLAAQNKLVQEYDTLSYDDIRTLTSDNMNFSEDSSTVSKAVSLCLSDYVSVVPNTLYKLEIIDVTESKLLDVAYFSSQRGYQKSDSGYGTNITDYDNSADLDSDIENNNGYTGGSSSNGGKLDTDNPNDIIDTDYNNSLANINISDIIVSLRTSIASVGVFFQSCWALFPPAIWSIILLGLSLIVVLRLLGR